MSLSKVQLMIYNLLKHNEVSSLLTYSNVKHGDELLDLFITSTGFLTLPDIAAKLNLSRRSIFYIIKRLNAELRADNLFEITNIHNVGYVLDSTTITALKKMAPSSYGHSLDLTKFEVYLPKKLEAVPRRSVMLFFLISHNGLSLNELSHIFGISKNTVIHDIRSLDKFLATSNKEMKIINTPNGKVVCGPEQNLRAYVFENIPLLSKYVNVNYQSSVMYDLCRQQLNLLEKITGNSFTGDALHNLTLFLHWYLIRLKEPKHYLKKYDYSGGELSYTWAQSLLRDHRIKSRYENRYLSFIVNTQPLSHINHTAPLLEKLLPISKKIVLNFENLAQLDLIKANPKLVRDIARHLVTTYYRTIYDIDYHNPLLKKIRSTHQQTFEYTKAALEPFTQFSRQPLSDDEIALVTTYFGSALYRVNLVQQEQNQPSVMVVCSSGIGTSRLLISSLLTRFPTVRFIGPFSTFQYENIKHPEAKLIISSIELPVKRDSSVPVLVVPVIPSQQDFQLIETTLARNNLIDYTGKAFTVDAIMDLISSYARIEDPKGLQRALTNYIKHPINQPKEKELLPSSKMHIHGNQFITAKVNWRSALHFALSPLTCAGDIMPKYEETIVHLTELYGPYMGIGQGIMLAHAKPSDGVKSLSANFTLFKHPFNLANSEKQIRLIITLAPIDTTSHMFFLERLLEAVQSSSWSDELAAIDSLSNLNTLLSSNRLH